MDIYSRSNNRFVVLRSDRIFLSLSKKVLNNWKESLVIVKPETVIKWHRQGFKLFWKMKNKYKGGRKRKDSITRKLIIQLAKENIYWGIPRIHRELLKLGYNISQSTVFGYLHNFRRKNPSQN